MTVQDTNRHIHFEKMKCSYAYMMPMEYQTVTTQNTFFEVKNIS